MRNFLCENIIEVSLLTVAVRSFKAIVANTAVAVERKLDVKVTGVVNA